MGQNVLSETHLKKTQRWNSTSDIEYYLNTQAFAKAGSESIAIVIASIEMFFDSTFSVEHNGENLRIHLQTRNFCCRLEALFDS
jgi:hypothetical protein